jgi:hypothetical protein
MEWNFLSLDLFIEFLGIHIYYEFEIFIIVNHPH